MDVRQEDLYTGKVKDIFYGMDGSGWVMGRMLGKEIIMKKLNIVLVGLGFGGAFVPIYKDHPGVGSIGIFDTDSSVMEEFARAHGIERLYHSFEEILEDEEVDAVHLVTPIPLHAKQTAAVLNAGKHCACTVPHGGFSGGNQGNYGGGEEKREKLYDDGDYALYEAVFLCKGNAYEGGIW